LWRHPHSRFTLASKPSDVSGTAAASALLQIGRACPGAPHWQPRGLRSTAGLGEPRRPIGCCRIESSISSSRCRFDRQFSVHHLEHALDIGISRMPSWYRRSARTRRAAISSLFSQSGAAKNACMSAMNCSATPGGNSSCRRLIGTKFLRASLMAARDSTHTGELSLSALISSGEKRPRAATGRAARGGTGRPVRPGKWLTPVRQLRFLTGRSAGQLLLSTAAPDLLGGRLQE
jgi:hypothetical protein